MRKLTAGLQLRAYQLQHRIGRGGEGDVWLAHDMKGQHVALKARPLFSLFLFQGPLHLLRSNRWEPVLARNGKRS